MAYSHLRAKRSHSGSNANFISNEEFGSAIDSSAAYPYRSSEVDMLEHDYVPVRAVPLRTPAENNGMLLEKATPESTVHAVGKGRRHIWKPFYLRRRFLYAFIIVFAIMIGAVQALVTISDKQTGLATSFADLHYLWTYGPTALLTVLTAVWARVEYQAKLIAPWARMSKGVATAERTVLLDYISVFQGLSIFTALRNRDTAVSAITTVSIILKVMIVVSTALITLSLTQVEQPDAPITIESQFVNDATGLLNIGSLPYFAMIGIKRGNNTLPEGLSQQFAYQQVNSLLRPAAEVRTTVDGFSAGLDCESASVNVTSLEESAGGPSPHWNLTITAPECEMKLYDLAPALNIELGTEKNFPSYFARLLSGGCGGSSDKGDKRFIVMFGRTNYTLVRGTKLIGGHYDNKYELNIFESTQLSCKPTYNISKVDIAKNGTDLQSIMLATDAKPRTLDAVHPWDLMQAHFDSFSNFISQSGGYQLETNITTGVSVDVDSAMKLAFDTHSPEPQASLLFVEDYLHDFFGAYWAQYAAIIAHTALTERVAQSSTAMAIVNLDRLLVRPLAGYLMEGLLGVAILLILIAAYTAPSKAILPRSPGTILGMAALLSHSQDFVMSLSQFGSATLSGITEHMRNTRYLIGSSEVLSKSSYPSGPFQIIPDSKLFGGSSRDLGTGPVNVREPTKGNSHPTTLSPALRIVVVFLLLGLIAALEATFRTSETHDGLGSVADDTYIHFLWTTGPAVLISLFGMYFAAVDFKIRSLVPFLSMKRYSSFTSSLDLDLLDLFTPHMLYREMRIRHTAALAATLCAFIASITTVFSGSLFLATSIPVASSAQLQTQDSFIARWTLNTNAGRQDAEEMESASSLILVSNLSYPAFTYEGLAFPQFVLDANFSSDSTTRSMNSTSVVVNASIPALRGRLDCRLYTSSDITTNLTLNYKDVYGNQNPLALNVSGEACRSTYGSNVILGTGNSTASRYFGAGYQADATHFVEACSDYLFAWGRLNMDTNPPSVAPMAIGCNESLEAVDTTASFLGTQLLIDTDNPPVPSNTSSSIFVVSPNATNSLTPIYATMANITSRTDNLDAFFVHLTTSRYAMPVSYLGDVSKAQTVIDAISFQHRVIRAQNLNARYRVGTNDTTDAAGGDANNPDRFRRLAVDPEYNVTVTDTLGRRRVVQDEASTRVLQALLAATLAFFLLGWGLMRDTDTLPRSPTGIASVAAFIADGNLLDHLPEDAEHLSDKQLQRRGFSSGSMFWMGWGNRSAESGEVNRDYTKGETFGIWVVEKDDNLFEQWEPR